MNNSMIASKFIANRIKEFEGGFHAEPYPDSYGYSVGFGHFLGRSVPREFQDGITREQAEDFFIQDVKETEKNIKSELKKVKFQNQKDALISLVYNIGSGTFYNGSIPDKIENQPGKVPETILLYNKATINGELQTLEGLKKRRKFEADLYNYDKLAGYWPIYFGF